MAVTVPARLMGQPALARVEGRPLGDLVCLGADWSFQGLASTLPQGEPLRA